jgi:hypothetical protein
VISILNQSEAHSSGYPKKVQLLAIDRTEETLKEEWHCCISMGHWASLWDTGPVLPYLANLTDSAINIHGLKQSDQGAFSQEKPLPKMDTGLLITNIVTDTGKRTSILLFQTSGSCDTGPRNNTKFFVGMIMNECAPNVAIHRQHQDCILPRHSNCSACDHKRGHR